jgi:hypothetical protein
VTFYLNTLIQHPIGARDVPDFFLRNKGLVWHDKRVFIDGEESGHYNPILFIDGTDSGHDKRVFIDREESGHYNQILFIDGTDSGHDKRVFIDGEESRHYNKIQNM